MKCRFRFGFGSGLVSESGSEPGPVSGTSLSGCFTQVKAVFEHVLSNTFKTGTRKKEIQKNKDGSSDFEVVSNQQPLSVLCLCLCLSSCNEE